MLVDFLLMSTIVTAGP